MKNTALYKKTLNLFFMLMISTTIISSNYILLYAKESKITHTKLTKKDLKYRDANVLEIQNILNRLKYYELKGSDNEYIKNSEVNGTLSRDKEALSNLLDKLIRYFDDYYTKVSLLEIEVDRDTTNIKKNHKLEVIKTTKKYIDNKALSKIRNLSKGVFCPILEEKFGKNYVDILKKDNTEYSKILPEYNRLKKIESNLLKEISDIKSMSLNKKKKINKDYKLGVNKSNLILSKYIELINIRNKIAYLFGYSNYANYADREIYCRDISFNKREEYIKAVKNYIVPLYKDVVSYDKKLSYSSKINKKSVPNINKIIKLVEPEIKKVDKTLETSFDYLVKNKTFDMDYNVNKIDQRYTLNLYKYNTGYIFNLPQNNYNDIKSFIHEFGKYNSIFYSNLNSINDVNNIDLKEMQSRFLEFIIAKDAKFAGKLKEAYKYTTYEDMLKDIVMGSYYDEMQFLLYSSNNLTLNDVNNYIKKLDKEYGLNNKTRGLKSKILENNELFDFPMKDISYSLSSLSAIKLGCLLEDNYKGAVNIYLKISKENGINSYAKLNEISGFNDLLSDKEVKKISKEVSKILFNKNKINNIKVYRIIKVIIYTALVLLFTLFIYVITRKQKMIN